MKKNVIKKTVVCVILLMVIGISTVPTRSEFIDRIHSSSSNLEGDTQSTLTNLTVPDCVEVGDLLLLDLPWVGIILYKFPGPYNEHSAIYIGNNTFVDATIPLVEKANYSHYYNLAKNFVFLRVKTANESQRQAAAAWAEDKIGLSYQHFYRPPWFALKIANVNLSFPTANEFYCMELLWAAYYNQGIDIDQNGWKFPWWLTGDEILNDDDIQIIYRNVANSTEITKPFKGIYFLDRKIIPTFDTTIILGDITIDVVTYNENVTHMDFYIDNEFRATDDSPPYQFIWNEHSTGRKMVKVIAYDSDGNQYYNAVRVWKIL